MSQTTVVNKFGVMQGWNSVTVNLFSRDLEGILKVAYNDEVAKENAKGAGMFPIGRARTGYEAEASLTLYKEEVDAIRKSMPPGKRLQDIAPFDIIVQYETQDGKILKDIIHNCEFTNDGFEVNQGDGTISTEYTLIVSHVTYNAA